MKIPFLDLEAHNASLRQACLEAIAEVVDSNAFAGGPFVDAFEQDFAQYCGTRHAVGVGSGTEALFLALLALGVEPGDEVVSPPNTFVAIGEAVSRCGARLVFSDVDARTCNLDPERLADVLTERTKAVVPTHLFGQTAEMEAIVTAARRRGIAVLEDASQAHGARYRGKRAGSLGDAAVFSFYPGKNLGAFGDAGAVVTDDAALAEKVRMLRHHGQRAKSRHELVGWTGRMDGIQAAVLRVKLAYVDKWNDRRRALAARYREQLQGIEELKLVEVAANCEPVYHVFAVHAPDRDRMIQRLRHRGVECSVHYPIPMHLQDAFRSLGYGQGDFPIAERSAASLLSLPMYPELTFDQIDYVCSALAEEVGALENTLR